MRTSLVLCGIMLGVFCVASTLHAQPSVVRQYTVHPNGTVEPALPQGAAGMVKNPTPAPRQTDHQSPATANETELSPEGDLGLPTLNMANYIEAIGMLFGLLALIFLGFYLLKKFSSRTMFGGTRQHQLTIESTLGLGPRKHVTVVRFLNKRMVLGVTDSSITCLHIQEDDDHADEETTSPSFQAAAQSVGNASSEGAAASASAGKQQNALSSFAARLKEQL